MASVMSIISKVMFGIYFILFILPAHFNAKSLILMLISRFFQCNVDKLVFIDVPESSTKGGSTDLEIFSLPKVEVFRGTSLSALCLWAESPLMSD